MNKKEVFWTVLAIVLILAATLITGGCSSTAVDMTRSVNGTITTTAHDAPETDNFSLTPQAAKMKVKLAKIRADVEIEKAKAQAKAEVGKAQAANPCSSWFMAPSYCYGYINGSYVVNSGRGGDNIVYRSR